MCERDSYSVVERGLSDKYFYISQTDVALLSLTACGTGLNLTRANVALFAELAWSPGLVLQAEDRIHRCVYFLARIAYDLLI